MPWLIFKLALSQVEQPMHLFDTTVILFAQGENLVGIAPHQTGALPIVLSTHNDVMKVYQ